MHCNIFLLAEETWTCRGQTQVSPRAWQKKIAAFNCNESHSVNRDAERIIAWLESWAPCYHYTLNSWSVSTGMALTPAEDEGYKRGITWKGQQAIQTWCRCNTKIQYRELFAVACRGKKSGKVDTCPFAIGTRWLLVQQTYCARVGPVCTLVLISRAFCRSGCSAGWLCSQSRNKLLQTCLEINRQSKKGETSILSW